MHRFDARSAQVCLQPQVEIRGVYANEHSRAFTQQSLAQLFANAQQLAQAAQHFHAVAMHGQFFAGPQAFKAPAGHLRAANTFGL